jgi:hypothetical protein
MDHETRQVGHTPSQASKKLHMLRYVESSTDPTRHNSFRSASVFAVHVNHATTDKAKQKALTLSLIEVD